MKKPIIIALSLVSAVTITSVSLGAYFGVQKNKSFASPVIKFSYDNDGVPLAQLKLAKKSTDVNYIVIFKNNKGKLIRKFVGAHNNILSIRNTSPDSRLVEIQDISKKTIWKSPEKEGIDLSLGQIDIKNKAILLNPNISKNASVNFSLLNTEGKEIVINKKANKEAKIDLTDNELFSLLNLTLNKITTKNNNETEKIKLVISDIEGIDVKKPEKFITSQTISSATINLDFVSDVLSLDPTQEIQAKFKQVDSPPDNPTYFSASSEIEYKDVNTYGLHFVAKNLQEATKYELVSLSFAENPYKNFDLLANKPFWSVPSNSDFYFQTATKDINLELTGLKQLKDNNSKYRLDLTFTSLPSSFYNKKIQVEYTYDNDKVLKSQPQTLSNTVSRYEFNFDNLKKNTKYTLSRIFVFDKSENDLISNIDLAKNDISDSFNFTENISDFEVVQTKLNSVKIKLNIDDDYKDVSTNSPLIISYKKTNDSNAKVETVSTQIQTNSSQQRFVEVEIPKLELNTNYEIVKVERNVEVASDNKDNLKTFESLIYYDKEKNSEMKLNFEIKFKILSASTLDEKTGKFALTTENNLDSFNNLDFSLNYLFTKENEAKSTEKVVDNSTNNDDKIMYEQSSKTLNLFVPFLSEQTGKYELKSLDIFVKNNKDKEKQSILVSNLQTLNIKSKQDLIKSVEENLNKINKNYLPSMVTKEKLEANLTENDKKFINSSLSITSRSIDDKKGELPVSFQFSYFGSTTSQSYTIKDFNKLVEIKDSKDKFDAKASSSVEFFDPGFALVDNDSYYSYWYADKTTDQKDITYTITPKDDKNTLIKEFWLSARKDKDYTAQNHLTSYFSVKITYTDDKNQEVTKDLNVNSPTEFTATTKTSITTQQRQRKPEQQITTTSTYYKWSFALDKLTQIKKIEITFKKEFQPKYVSIFKIRFIQPEKDLPQN
ncbi:lipoprotein 17-related variable surface protein [Mycoplasma sp. 1654_15]|uniref:lipoprotein 17-related variable surface protein n=1 Tax=Mycoplasma sp. 1654_15 TaxID=2725994 RepID=UPI0014497334|nr:lipoprotein 17-related variable surface protein [Mycoplasma sp. 1654_15]QJB71375.1 hypothetical protein HF996_02760 [Mycoplasma sp. 1654_15]